MNLSQIVNRSSEPDASSISPLLGTNKVQGAVDSMARAASKVATSLGTASAALQRLATNVQKTAGNGSAGFGNGATLSGGKQNGGGPNIGVRPGLNNGTGTFMGMPSWQHQQTMTQQYGSGGPQRVNNGGHSHWARYGATLGASAGYGMIDRVHAGVAGMVGDNTAAQMMARSSTMSWQDIRASMVRNNFTATSSTDAMAGGAISMRAGFAVGSSGHNSLLALGKNYRVMDPTATSAEAFSRLTGFQSVGASNFLVSRGIRGGGDPRATADQIIRQAGYTPGHRFTQEQIAKQWSARGNATMLVQNVEQSMGKDAAEMVRDRLRATMQVSMSGKSMAEFDKAVSSGDWNKLDSMGYRKTDLDAIKDVGASKRNIEDDLAGGFSKGLSTATAALEQFYNTLGQITGAVGSPIGFGAGVLGSSGIASGAASIGSNVLGGYLGAKGLGWAAGRIGGRAGVAALLRGGAGAAGAGTAGGGIAAALGSAGIGVLAAAPVAAAISATSSDEERARRKAQLMKQGAGDSWWTDVNAWAGAFNNDMTLGLTDRMNEWLGKGSNEGEHHGRGGYGGMGYDGGALGSFGVGGSETTGGGVLPVGNAKVTAPFGKYPNSGKRHYGVDFGVPVGTPVKANKSGRVYFAGYDKGGFGISIRIDTGDGEYHIYGHLSKLNVRVGDTVKVGQVIGYSGNTGNSSGPHLHFEKRKGGKGINSAINPLAGASSTVGVSEPANDPNTDRKTFARSNGNMLSSVWGVNESDLISGALAATGMSAAPRGSEADAGPSAATNAGSAAQGSLKSILAKAGFRGNALDIAYAVAMAESRGNPKAHNGNANTGDDSYGLFQINMLGGMGPERRKRFGLRTNEALYDPVTNARVAYEMSGRGTDWHDWSTYKNGSYKKFLGGQVKSYDVGSTNVDVDQIARVHKGEMILDPVTSDELRKALSTNSPTSIFGKSKGGGIHIDKIEIFTGHAFTGAAASDLARQFLDAVASHDQYQTIREG